MCGKRRHAVRRYQFTCGRRVKQRSGSCGLCTSTHGNNGGTAGSMPGDRSTRILDSVACTKQTRRNIARWLCINHSYAYAYLYSHVFVPLTFWTCARTGETDRSSLATSSFPYLPARTRWTRHEDIRLLCVFVEDGLEVTRGKDVCGVLS
jgi:hypothetical protein